MQVYSDSKVKNKFASYPKKAQEKLLILRRIILQAAEENDKIEALEETLKWNEPSYLVKNGSTIRMDWKVKSPEQFAIYFKCTSKLVPTFKVLFGKELNFEGNRAIVFNLEEEIPKEKIKQCISLALQYHQLKHLPLLGLEADH